MRIVGLWTFPGNVKDEQEFSIYPSFLLHIHLIQILSLICNFKFRFIFHFFFFLYWKSIFDFFRLLQLLHSHNYSSISNLSILQYLFQRRDRSVKSIDCSQLLKVLDIIRRTRNTRETINYSRYSASLLNNTPSNSFKQREHRSENTVFARYSEYRNSLIVDHAL